MTTSKTRSDGERFYLLIQHLSRRIRDINAACGITNARFLVLVNLAFHGINNVGELAASGGVGRPGMTRLIRDMEASGLVRRMPDSEDGRGVLVQITKKGRETVDRVRQEKIAMVTRHIEALDAPARRAV